MVAERKRHTIATSQELRISIEKKLPPALRGLVDVFVLDVSKANRPFLSETI
jgi:hypothetical protein